MDESVELYNQFIERQKSEIQEYFTNYPKFENQFEFNTFNRECYQKMFSENSQDNIKTVKELKGEIENLPEMCSKCGPFFVKPRNKSIKGLDIQMGIFLENQIIDFLNSIGIKALHADKTNKRYPDCMILKKDKGILAYFEVKYHSAPFINAIRMTNRYCYEGSVTLDFDKICKQIEIIESDLDRPTFYLHWIDYPCLKGIFFETSEQVKENIYEHGVEFEREPREGDYRYTSKIMLKKGYLKKYYSPLLEMGTFDEFIKLIRSLQ